MVAQSYIFVLSVVFHLSFEEGNLVLIVPVPGHFLSSLLEKKKFEN